MAFDSNRRAKALLVLLPSWLTVIFRVVQLRDSDFISSGHRHESTTRNIPELGISTENLRLGVPIADENTTFNRSAIGAPVSNLSARNRGFHTYPTGHYQNENSELAARLKAEADLALRSRDHTA
jgi:hypothetical protein